MPSTSKKQHNFMEAIAHSPAFAKKVGVKQSVGKDFAKADKGKTFKKGGDIVGKLFKGKETYKEELSEAKAIKSGKITPQQYAKGEEGEKVKKMAAGGKVDPKVVAMLNAQAKNRPVARPPMRPPMAPPMGAAPTPPMSVPRPPMAPPARPPMGAPMGAPTGAPMKKGGKVKETMGPRTMSKDVEKGSNKLIKFGESAVQKRGHTKGMEERGYKVEKIQGGAKGGKGVYGAKPIKMAAGGSTSSRGDGIAQRGRTKTKYC